MNKTGAVKLGSRLVQFIVILRKIHVQYETKKIKLKHFENLVKYKKDINYKTVVSYAYTHKFKLV